MIMTAKMLAGLLKPEYICECKEDFPFSRISFADGICGEPDVLYLLPGQDSFAPNQLVVAEHPQGSFTLQVPAEQISAAVNHILRRFQDYLHWREECVRLSKVECDLEALLECGSRFTGCDFWIIDQKYIFRAGRIRDAVPEMKANERIPKDELEQLYQDNPHFDQTFLEQGVKEYAQSWVPDETLYYDNIFLQSFYLGRLLFLVPDDRNSPGFLRLLESFCGYVESCYQICYMKQQEKYLKNQLHGSLLELLKERPVEHSELVRLLAEVGWKEHDSYELIQLYSVGYHQAEVTLDYYAVQIESDFADSIVVQMEERLFCLHRLDAASRQDYRQKLSVWLRENLFKAGISNEFGRICDICLYRKQTDDALRLGQQKDPSFWRYSFCDYLYEYSLQRLGEYPARELCPPNLSALLKYEEAHPEAELLETLYQYFACGFNAVKAAEKLYIHRTTFFYRMNKIKLIAAFQPEDWEEHMQVMLAFSALRKEGVLSGRDGNAGCEQ